MVHPDERPAHRHPGVVPRASMPSPQGACPEPLFALRSLVVALDAHALRLRPATDPFHPWLASHVAHETMRQQRCRIRQSAVSSSRVRPTAVPAARPGLRADARTSHDDEVVSRVKRQSEVEGATQWQ